MFVSHSRSISGKRNVTRPGLIRLGMAACSMCVRFCTYVVIARTLGPQAFGVFLFAQWLAGILIPEIGMGASPRSSRQLAELQSQETPESAAGVFRFLWRRQWYSVSLYCVLYPLLVFPVSWLFGGPTSFAPLFPLLLAGLSALPLLLSGVAGIALQSTRRFELLASIRLFSALLTLLLVLAGIQLTGERVAILLVATALATTLTLAMALLCVVRLLPLRGSPLPGPFLRDRLLRCLRHSWFLFLVDGIVWQRSELLVLAHWRSTAELGFYALSALLYTRIMEVSPTLLATCVLPLLSHFFPQHRYVNSYDAFVKTSCYVAFLTIPIWLLATLFCPLLVVTCFGAEYLPMVMPLRILLLAALVGSISTVSLTHLSQSEHKQGQVRLGIAVAVLHVILAIPCIALWGVTGAALASASTHILFATGSILLCRRLLIRFDRI